jgi:hypothetical protein
MQTHKDAKVLRRLAALSCVAAIGALGASAASADPPTPLGGLTDLRAYCQSLGYTDVVLKKGYVVGDQAAYNNWRCYADTPTNTHPFSMEQACTWAYGVNAVQAHPLNPDDAFTWVCYSSEHL